MIKKSKEVIVLFNQISKQDQFPHQRIAIIWGQDEVVNVENGSAGEPDLEENLYDDIVHLLIFNVNWFGNNSKYYFEFYFFII